VKNSKPSMLSVVDSTRRAIFVSCIALTVGLTSCNPPKANNPSAGDGTSPSPNAGSPTTPGTVSTSPSGSGPNVGLNGAGASFPAPLYETWFAEYYKKNPNIKINYQSVGSGAGVKQFIEGTVDFGASDVAMKDEEIAKVTKGVLLLPMTAGSIVLAYNLPGVEGLKLSREAYADIFLGKIKKWNDPKIAAANPTAKLPDKDITVIHRSDGSGTTGVFTKHLSAINEEWKKGPGEGKDVKWPTGNGAKGNDGVTYLIKQTEGSIGYIEYGYAKNQGITMASLENKAGKYVEASTESSSKALAAVKLPENFRAFIADPEGEDSYPIVTYTWLLVYKKYDDPTKAKAMKDVIKWGLTDGQQFGDKLGYVPLPKEVVDQVSKAVDVISP